MLQKFAVPDLIDAVFRFDCGQIQDACRLAPCVL